HGAALGNTSQETEIIVFSQGPRNKSGARLASPQPRPTSPVNGAGGITGCGKDARAERSFQPRITFFELFSR
ncbi:MAG: hypothetical protein WA650_11265, partial [Bradyrhizobium sp.]